MSCSRPKPEWIREKGWREILTISKRGGEVKKTANGLAVILGDQESRERRIEGLLRHDRAVLAGRNEKVPGASSCSLWAHTEGSCSESAVARALGIYWAPSSPERSDWHNGDVGGWEVRHSGYRSAHLIIKESDAADRPFVLTIGQWPLYWIRGYLVGRDGMQECYRQPADQNGPAYWKIPQSVLVPLRGDEGEWPISHRGECGTENCPACRYELVRQRLEPGAWADAS
jgi:hypothetical protein